jgi:hypothetical protein
MNCSEAEVYVSAVCDGEQIAQDVAEHIARCAACRSALSDYARIGAELRLLSMKESVPLPPLTVPAMHGPFAFLWKRVAVPRFAILGLIACAVVAVATTSIVRAQSKTLWFEFGYSPRDADPTNYLVAKEGFDETPAYMGFPSGNLLAAALRIKIESISNEDVVFQLRAVPARTEVTATGVQLLGGPAGGVSLDGVRKVHYKPGESLPIPIEGGGTLYLKGDVLDHQPKIAFGTPLLPAVEKMNVRSPVLLDSTTLLGDLQGMSATANASDQTVFISVGGRVFSFALRPFPGAVQGEANWGEISFKFESQGYRLMAAAPITGGDQPRPVWVRAAEPSDWGPRCDSPCLGTGPLPK